MNEVLFRLHQWIHLTNWTWLWSIDKQKFVNALWEIKGEHTACKLGITFNFVPSFPLSECLFNDSSLSQHWTLTHNANEEMKGNGKFVRWKSCWKWLIEHVRPEIVCPLAKESFVLWIFNVFDSFEGKYIKKVHIPRMKSSSLKKIHPNLTSTQKATQCQKCSPYQKWSEPWTVFPFLS